MRTTVRTLGQAVVVLILGLVVGLGANNVRGKNSIDLFRSIGDPNAVPGDPNRPPAEPPFTELSLDETVALFRSPDTAAGIYVFLDARNEDAYASGHIPGAYQCDYWTHGFAEALDQFINQAGGANRIIVYCNGGECEDSLKVCHELVLHGIPQEIVNLFRGGWEEWSKGNLPITTGKER